MLNMRLTVTRVTRAALVRRAATLSVAGAGGMLAAACGPDATPAQQGKQPSKEPVKLSLSTDWTTGIRAETVKRWTIEFPKVNPNVREVEVWTTPAEGTTAGAYNVKVQTAIAAGSGPDVMMEVWPVNPPSILLHLDPYLKQRRFNKADYWWSKSYQETEDGRIFSLPMGAYVGGMVANVDLFERTGVKLPGKDWTFNDLRDIARKLKSDRVWGVERQTGAWDQGWTNRFASEGAEWYDRKTLKTTLHVGKDGGKPQEMFEDWWGLVWKDRIAPNPDEVAQVRANAGMSSGPLFATGLIGLSGFPFYQAGIQKEAIAGKFRFQALWPPKSPYSGRRGYHLETNCISISKTAKSVDEAFELGFYWLTDPMSQFLAANLPVMPPGRKWHRSKEVTSVAPGMEIFADVADEAQKIGNDRHKWQGGTGASPKSLEWLRAVRAPLEQDAINKGGDPRVALRESIAAGDRALA
ncbi:MAG: extracellular solute-binding protein [Chloroflexi bacterium]|nr:extracellular solute-binding protein [Chloroflexota bacterium]